MWQHPKDCPVGVQVQVYAPKDNEGSVAVLTMGPVLYGFRESSRDTAFKVIVQEGDNCLVNVVEAAAWKPMSDPPEDLPQPREANPETEAMLTRLEADRRGPQQRSVW
ncbi:MAG: hypothetical protein ACFCUR_20940 [Rhodomicrobiaceae bacterium]